MNVSIYPWEKKLLEWAYDALDSCSGPEAIDVDKKILDDAYEHCDKITKEHSLTFHLASGLLPPDKKRSARALYAFCRVSDDLVDRSDDDPKAGLEKWRQIAIVERPSLDDPVTLAWADTRTRYRIPVMYGEQLIEGVGRDLTSNRYENFASLAEYCYGVAATVGLMVMHIIGFSSREAVPYAVKLGVSLQLSNILRDVGEDWQTDRLYLPNDELAQFGLSEDDIAQGCIDDRWRAFMRFQIDRNRRLYAESLPGIAMLNRDGRFAIAVAAELYCAILDDIEAHGMDVFSRRAHVDFWGKLHRLPGIWWRSQTLTYTNMEKVG